MSNSNESENYKLGERFIDGHCVEYSTEKAIDLLNARNALSALRQIEELFSLFVRSFMGFEKAMLVAGIDYLFDQRSNSDLESFFEDVHDQLNLTLLTLLTAYQSYEDHLAQKMVNLEPFRVGMSLEAETVRTETYDSSLEYRIACGLRNYAQHANLPLYGISYGSEIQSEPANESGTSAFRERVVINPYFSADALASSGKLKNVRNEIKNLGVKQIDAKQLVRGFVEAMTTRHKRIQELTKDILAVASKIFVDAYYFVSESKGAEAKHLDLVKMDGLDEREKFYIGQDLPSRLLTMRAHPSALARAQRVYMSSEPTLTKNSYQGSNSKIWIT